MTQVSKKDVDIAIKRCACLGKAIRAHVESFQGTQLGELTRPVLQFKLQILKTLRSIGISDSRTIAKLREIEGLVMRDVIAFECDTSAETLARWKEELLIQYPHPEEIDDLILSGKLTQNTVLQILGIVF